MKYLPFLFLIALLSIASPVAYAQKVGYTDTQSILDNMNDYKAVEKELDQLSQQWEKEIKDAYDKIEKMYQDYRAKEVLLSKEDKERLQNDIMEEEKKAKELQRSRFGANGELFRARQEKMKPVQERVYRAIEDVAKSNKVALMLDKAGSTIILYSDPALDYTKQVMDKLGIKPAAADTKTTPTSPTAPKKP
jgi:outer membrane protein